MSGAVIQLHGFPHQGLRQTKGEDEFTSEISSTRGRPVHPVCFHRSGLLEYVWYSHGVAVPAILYDQSIRYLDSVRFTIHRDMSAIQVRQNGEAIGLVWGCIISAPEVIASARERLGFKSVRFH